MPPFKRVKHQIGNQKQIKLIIPVGMMKPDSIISLRRHPKRTENLKQKNLIQLVCLAEAKTSLGNLTTNFAAVLFCSFVGAGQWALSVVTLL